LSPCDIDRLVSTSYLKRYDSEYVLHYESSRCDRLLFLIDGLAKAYKVDKHGNEIFLYYIHKDHMLSEISTLQGESLVSYSNIILVESSEILSIDYKKFQHYFLDEGVLCLELAQEIVYQSNQLQDLVSREFLFDSVAKVAMMLHSDLEMFNRLKRYDVSAMLHIQPATLSRVLNRLKNNNIISIEHGHISVLDMDRLESIYKESGL